MSHHRHNLTTSYRRYNTPLYFTGVFKCRNPAVEAAPTVTHHFSWLFLHQSLVEEVLRISSLGFADCAYSLIIDVLKVTFPPGYRHIVTGAGTPDTIFDDNSSQNWLNDWNPLTDQPKAQDHPQQIVIPYFYHQKLQCHHHLRPIK